MKTYLSWSGGKDSSASIVLCYEKGIHLDGVVMSEVMFDHSRNISGEDPMHIKWVYEVAKPTIEKMGFRVLILRDKQDYLSLFNRRLIRSKKVEYIGKKCGWLVGGKCSANGILKMRPLRQFFKRIGEFKQIVGIALDEPNRLDRLRSKPNVYSILAQEGVTEADTYDICRKYDLLSPIYEEESRGGCWFCPNSSIDSFARFAKKYSELWAELKKLSHDPDIVSQGFKYGRTFESVNREVQFRIKMMNYQQISFFD